MIWGRRVYTNLGFRDLTFMVTKGNLELMTRFTGWKTVC